MKKQAKLLTGLVFLIVVVFCTYGQMSVSKPMPPTQGDENSYSFPVMFTGRILDYADFKFKSQGQLAVVRGNHDAANAIELPFYIHLERNGKIVKDDKMNFFNLPVHSIEISDILSFSQPGDVLVIVPVTKPDGKTKVILKSGC